MAIGLLSGCAEHGYERLSGQTMGTYFLVQFAPTPACHPTLADVELQLADLNAIFSTYQPDSEVSRLNASAVGETSAVSTPMRQVLLEARRVWTASGGAFDVTVGPLVNLWGFGPNEQPAVPDEAAQAQAAALVGMDKLALDLDVVPATVRKTRVDQYIDLSALAKGYAVDAVAENLNALGCADYMVDIGGEIRVRGASPRGGAWRIGIERPDASGVGQISTVIALADVAVATSGDYRNFRMVDGRRVDHVIDPRSGRPAATPVVSATVIAGRAMTADAFATALLVLDPEDGLALADQAGLAAYLLIADVTAQGESSAAPEKGEGAGMFRARYNPRMAQYLPQ